MHGGYCSWGAGLRIPRNTAEANSHVSRLSAVVPRVSATPHLQQVLCGQRWSWTGRRCEGTGAEKLAVCDGLLLTQRVDLCGGLRALERDMKTRGTQRRYL